MPIVDERFDLSNAAIELFGTMLYPRFVYEHLTRLPNGQQCLLQSIRTGLPFTKRGKPFTQSVLAPRPFERYAVA